MRKLQKSSLNELAQKMPVVSEKESAKCIGGDYYFDRSGNYLGVTQTGFNIYYSNSNDFNNYYQSNPDYLASISVRPSVGYGNFGVEKKVAEHFLPVLENGGQYLVHTGVAIGNRDTVHDLRSAYNGTDLFINNDGYFKSFDNLNNLNQAYYYARYEAYYPGVSLRI